MTKVEILEQKAVSGKSITIGNGGRVEHLCSDCHKPKRPWLKIQHKGVCRCEAKAPKAHGAQ